MHFFLINFFSCPIAACRFVCDTPKWMSLKWLHCGTNERKKMEIEHPKPINQMQILVCTWSLTQTSNSIQHIAAYHSYSESIFQRVNNRRLIHVSLFSRLFLFGRGLFKQNQNELITLCYSQIPFWIRSIEHCQSQNSSLRWINVRCIWLVIRFGEAFFWPHLSIWTDCVVCCSVFFSEIFEL